MDIPSDEYIEKVRIRAKKEVFDDWVNNYGLNISIKQLEELKAKHFEEKD